MVPFIQRVISLYYNGFREMTLGKTLWKIVFIKLIVMFAVLKLFFFPNYLKTQYDTDQQRADHVINQITQTGRELIDHRGGTIDD